MESPIDTRRKRSSLAARESRRRKAQYTSVELDSDETLTDLATPAANISAFCRATLSKLLPTDFWGRAAEANDNERVFMGHVDKFIHLRRFETMSLHTAAQGLKVNYQHSSQLKSLI